MTLWLCGSALGLFFLISASEILPLALYVLGCVFFLSSIETVQDFIRNKRRGQRTRLVSVTPLVFGLVAWSLACSIQETAIPLFLLFLLFLAFSTIEARRGRERSWEARIPFGAAVVAMSLFGFVLSRNAFSLPYLVFLFIIPFSFFSSQELFVQNIIDKGKGLANSNAAHAKNRKTARGLLWVFVAAYVIVSALTLEYASSFVATFILLIISVPFPPLFFISSTQKIELRKLGIIQAALDVILVLGLLLFYHLLI